MNEAQQTPPEPTPVFPTNLGKLVLDPWQHALAAGMRQALKVGVPAHNVIEMLLNHLASVVAMLEPPGVRAETVKALVEHFPSMVRQHVDARDKTPGGVFVPPGVKLNGHAGN